MSTIRQVGFATVVALFLAIIAAVALAQPPQGMKLYVLSSGELTIGKHILMNLGPQDAIKVPVAFFVVMHPKGNVLFDTGNNDKIITDPGYWGPLFKSLSPVNTPDVVIEAQLAKIGLKPDDITYVVVGHLHLDHGGNVAKFPNSTLIVQKDEIRNAFWPEPGTAFGYIPGDVAPLRSDIGEGMPNKYKMLQLNGDMDIFGDGSVVAKRWVGHTPGSQMLLVRLPKTGTIILTSDNVYFRENVEKNILPNVALAYDPAGILRAYEWIRYLQATEKADFFTAHDPDAFKALKKPPEYYD
jgi:glyoxylase-like metal-dependent hydrolase (beta-lactamase superfamily II)